MIRKATLLQARGTLISGFLVSDADKPTIFVFHLKRFNFNKIVNIKNIIIMINIEHILCQICRRLLSYHLTKTA